MKLRKFTNNYDENVDNGEHNSSNSYNENDNTNDDYNSSSGSSKNKIHSYKTIKNESQLLELFITSIPTRIHKASITVLKLCSTNYAIKSKIGLKLFYYIFTVWSIYGIAAIMTPEIKNNMYNVLDIFAKNFFGLYLCYRISNIVTISK